MDIERALRDNSAKKAQQILMDIDLNSTKMLFAKREDLSEKYQLARTYINHSEIQTTGPIQENLVCHYLIKLTVE